MILASLLMLSDLHIEMAFLSAIVKWLDNSEWVNCLSESTITTRGVADSFHGVRGEFQNQGMLTMLQYVPSTY